MGDIKKSELTLKQLRQLKGLTVRDMGNLMGMSFQKYQHKESGNTRFILGDINKLCEIFETDRTTIEQIINNTKKK